MIFTALMALSAIAVISQSLIALIRVFFGEPMNDIEAVVMEATYCHGVGGYVMNALVYGTLAGIAIYLAAPTAVALVGVMAGVWFTTSLLIRFFGNVSGAMAAVTE